MAEERMVPVEERYLVVEGIVSRQVFEKARDGLSEKPGSTSLCCFLSYAYTDVFVGQEFQRIFRRRDILECVSSSCVIKSVTQQFSMPLDRIPAGWKTICILDFPQGLPELMKQLPVVSNWFEADSLEHLCLSDDETWMTLKAAGRTSL